MIDQSLPNRLGPRPGRAMPRRLALASALEGTTLLLLLLVAVPLKHFAGLPVAVHMMGPAHGLAFAFYAWSVIEAAAALGWSGGEVARLLAAALVPFGAFRNFGILGIRGIFDRLGSPGGRAADGGPAA